MKPKRKAWRKAPKFLAMETFEFSEQFNSKGEHPFFVVRVAQGKAKGKNRGVLSVRILPNGLCQQLPFLRLAHIFKTLHLSDVNKNKNHLHLIVCNVLICHVLNVFEDGVFPHPLSVRDLIAHCI